MAAELLQVGSMLLLLLLLSAADVEVQRVAGGTHCKHKAT
jgi:hypothetical protein